ncbi:MAG: hypothetical protein KatS3mg023_3120 [Armatimonadota bacterium]|nr:MAG: hypothetical protein KatS3mg023_3120 [Armatimonadota bacterium]
MSQPLMTRRQFHLALMTSVVALAAPGGAQEPSTHSVDTLPADVVNSWLPAPMPPEQAQKVAEAVKSMQQTLANLRAYPLPEGSEPAFVFQPRPLRKEKR